MALAIWLVGACHGCALAHAMCSVFVPATRLAGASMADPVASSEPRVSSTAIAVVYHMQADAPYRTSLCLGSLRTGPSAASRPGAHVTAHDCGAVGTSSLLRPHRGRL